MSIWRRVALTLAAVVVVAVGVAPPSIAQTKDPLDEPIGSDTIVNAWAVSPAGPSTDPTQPSERPYLTYSVVPGQVINDAVTLFNYSNVPLNFRLFAADAFNNAEGAFDVPPSDVQAKEVGSWVTVAQQNIALGPKSQATVPITVTVPAKTSPGDHAGAILASSATVGQGPDGKTVNVDRRTGTRMYIRVAGPIHPELSITKVSNTYRPSINPFSGKVDVTYRVQNDGNVRLAGKHRVEVSGLLGLGKKSSKFVELPELLPGQGVTLKASFKGMPAAFLAFANAKVDPDNAEGQTLGVVSRRAATMAVPWTIISLALIAYLGRRAYKQYKGHLDAQ